MHLIFKFPVKSKNYLIRVFIYFSPLVFKQLSAVQFSAYPRSHQWCSCGTFSRTSSFNRCVPPSAKTQIASSPSTFSTVIDDPPPMNRTTSPTTICSAMTLSSLSVRGTNRVSHFGCRYKRWAVESLCTGRQNLFGGFACDSSSREISVLARKRSSSTLHRSAGSKSESSLLLNI